MRFALWVGVLFLASIPRAYAPPVVPEIDASAGLSALGVIGPIAMLIWERRRHKRRLK